ncbi:hypothetical protein ACFFMN_04675 [Planobispora siamensis]|uniref:Uncharacterized protein n=1 Tax=Planobispora siamensis TaxID=936338 RepID=A0A8J3WK83_9ACTN|nr:hypothetical protein [Planobispora siamensis]GIH92345.1 hypothetical protein Psi01_29750 [Planobispora siamensis]
MLIFFPPSRLLSFLDEDSFGLEAEEGVEVEDAEDAGGRREGAGVGR